MQSDDIKNKIIRIISEMHGNRPESIDLTTELYRDLGIDGDDAVELFEMLSEEFKIDFSTIQWGRHFGPEGFNPFTMLTPSFWRKEIPITLQDLINSAIIGEWTKSYQ